MDDQTHDLIDPQVSAEAFLDPVLAQFQTQDEQAHWQDELHASREERRPFHKRGVATIKRYADERDNQTSQYSSFNIFFANTEIKSAALYARTPQPDIKRRFPDADDQVSRVAANILQRNIVYELECESFDAHFKQVLFDRLVPGVGVGWARLEQDYGDLDYDATTGAAVPGSDVKRQLAALDYVPWDAFLWAPCRVWTECRWVGRVIPMTKTDVSQRFGTKTPPAVLASLPFTTPVPTDKSQGLGDDPLRPKHVVEPTVDVVEIWDKSRELIFWVTDGADVPLDVQADTNRFPDFFPTPLPPLGRFTTSSTTPISDFSLVQAQYNELDDLNNRAAKLIQALQLRWVYDQSNTALRDLYTTTGELQGVGVKDWTSFMTEKGGISGALQFAPLNEIASTYQELVRSRDLVKAQIYETEGISDFLRGVQQPYVTAAAATATGQASSNRMVVAQQDVADYLQRLLRLKAHLICKFYTPQSIMQAAGALPQADQPYVPAALQLLQNGQLRHFRLSVSVDSLQAETWNSEKAERNELIQAITAFLGQTIPAIERNPAFAPFAIQGLKFMVAGYKGAKDFEGTLDAALQQLMAAQQQQQQQPPKPTPAELKMQGQQQQVQADLQVAQMEQATKLQIAQMQAQLAAQDQQLKQFALLLREREAATRAAHQQVQTHIDVVEGAHQQALDLTRPGGM